MHDRIDLGHGITVVIDGNSKITGSNGTYANPVPNAFSLPASSVGGADSGACPGSTATCRASCYVRGLAKHAPDVYAAYHENATALIRIFDSSSEIAYDTADSLGAWIEKHARFGFRWHVSGDVWNWEHALWIKNVCRASRDVPHWIYTRTLDVVDILTVAPNLAVNVSADRENYNEARAVASRTGARLAYMTVGPHEWHALDEASAYCPGCGQTDGPGVGITNMPCVPDDLPTGSVVFPDYPLRGRDLPDPTIAPYWQNAPHKLRVMTCPADFFGQSESARCGPCNKCMVK
jgi:hypothetical protein